MSLDALSGEKILRSLHMGRSSRLQDLDTPQEWLSLLALSLDSSLSVHTSSENPLFPDSVIVR